MVAPPDLILHLSCAGVSLIVDSRAGKLPSILHWGAQLGELDDDALFGLSAARVPVIGSNNVESPPRVAVLPEHHTGWTGRPGIAGSADGRGWSPRFTVTSIELDGELVDGVVVSDAGRAVFHAADDQGILSLRLELELLPSGLVRTRATLKNEQEAAYAVDDVSLCFPLPAEATEVLDFTGQHNFERHPQRGPLRAGIHLRENRRGRTAADSAYVLHAGAPGFGFAAGRIWAVHTAWSGNHRHYAERVYTGEQVLGGGEVLLPGEVILEHGDEYQSPWVYGSYGDGLDEIAHRFHDHLRAIGASRPAERPVTLNVWEAVYFRHDAAELIALADQAAAIGIERFVLDDGWFGARRTDRAGLGDWVVSTDVWPDGLHPLVDHVRAKGMQFGLWFEPEMVNLDSDLARRHPEWIMAARDELPVESRAQQVLNLAAPGAYEHVKSQMLALLDEYPIDYIKWDHNRDLTEAGDRAHGGRPIVHEQTLAFYRLLRELRDAHPDLEIESCSSGGGRVDLGVLELTDRVWVSDNSDPHDRQAMMRWTAQLAPPEYLGAHIASDRSHTTGRRLDLSFRASTAIFGHLGIEWDLGEATDAELALLARWIEFHKEHRALLLGGEIVRMDTPDPRINLHGVVAADDSEAIFSAAVLDTTHPDPPAPLKLRGLDPDRVYHVTPVFIGTLPSGLVPPAWWGEPSDADVLATQEYWDRADRVDVSFTGARFRGDVLATVGVASPRVHPDQAVLYRAVALD
ncbi:alpha-galactosidase [Microbacterium sp. cf046]|uniref:alpha-galactosidase n=1 Tax=Microbacterium sp. cf046 TaxID=1761803 RepID=UPI0008ED2CAF|nr:alpha-galactosidase [Microbacterium sp. cf046]SFS16002.1 alpha-galactosidase [Microbacterium sp. cf046]